MGKWRSNQSQFVIALLIATMASIGLFAIGAWRNHSRAYDYLIWNLFLAWLPLLFAVRLAKVLKHKLWSSWEAMALSLLWLIFLPNSFYMISDFLHIQDVQTVDVLYDVVMFTSFIYTGVLLGFASLYLMHLELKQRLSGYWTAGCLGATLLLSSFAIYLGRDLRWNSWDVLTNPGGLLFDVSDRLQHPAAYPTMLVTIVSFFVLLSSTYYLAWRSINLIQSLGQDPDSL